MEERQDGRRGVEREIEGRGGRDEERRGWESGEVRGGADQGEKEGKSGEGKGREGMGGLGRGTREREEGDPKHLLLMRRKGVSVLRV